MRPRAAGKSEQKLPPPPPSGTPAATGPRFARWLLRGKDDRLTAYAPTPGGVLRWTETAPGGPDWSGPEFFPAPGIEHLVLAQGPDGYVHLIGRRKRKAVQKGPTVDIVHAIQYQTGRPLTAWHSLGNPYTDPDRITRIGVPVSTVNAAGSVHVFVRNAGGGVQMRRQAADGKWENWKDLRGSKTQDCPAAVATATGTVEVLAAADSRALRWTQEKPGGELKQAEAIELSPVAGTVTGLETAEGAVTYYWNDAASKGITAHRPGADTVPLGGTPSDGPLAALRTAIDGHDCTVLAHRGSDGQALLAACVTQAEAEGVWWTETGGECLGAPALAVDVKGRVVMAVIGADGGLHVARQKPEEGLALAAWTRV
ncbi:hypothetical protein [Streptomyces sp. H27-C3]|uniref:hypothetical protein n=1 Tax=Streptomyces sp. H27-C3 TaxID=3046305 RepID=UPI0024B88D75|nr:hypothetical protein [Streptomyces sp. H27-C3]MDJ0464220.1 hypothetical protein [Streptomyces sp. H27-C3]